MYASNPRHARDKFRRYLPARCITPYVLVGFVVFMAESTAIGQDTVKSQTHTAPLSLDLAPVEQDAMSQPLVTDRPDFTESTLTVPAGHAQLESGYTFTYDRNSDVRTSDHAFPEILLRVGLVEDVELRIEWAGWSYGESLYSERNDAGRTVNVSDRTLGVNDMGVGFKFHLLDQDGWQPDFGIIAKVDIPTGNQGLSSGDIDPLLGLLWAYDLDDRSSIAGNFNLALPADDGERFFETSASVSFAYSITDDLGAYIEYFGFYPSGGNDTDTHYVNGGFTYLVTKGLQFDIRVGHGLNDEADDLFAGAGFSIRY